MCGIVGYIGKEQAAPILLEGLARLGDRGYDSAGICVAENGVLKRDLSIDELRSELKNGLIMQKKAEPRRLNFRLIRKDAAQLRKEADAPDENA